MSIDDIYYGPVKVVEGPLAGRIGYYDDDDHDFEDEDDEVGIAVAIVYFGDPFIARGYYPVPATFIRAVTTEDLLRRREELHDLCGGYAKIKNPKLKIKKKDEFNYLAELHYVDAVLVDRMVKARYSTESSGKKIFISHSSKDKTTARWIGTDLKAAGHTPWFDEWDIHVGESIPEKISEGLSSADFVIVVLSEHAIQSKWVEREWQAKYWSEVEKGRIHVLPALLRDCELPELLKMKKYADFRHDYSNGIEDLLVAIDSLSKKSQE